MPTRKTLLASQVVRIAPRYIRMGSVCIIAIMLAQIVQLVRRAKVAQVAVDAQPVRLANTKQVLLKKTVKTVILVRIRFQLGVAGLQRENVEIVFPDNI